MSVKVVLEKVLDGLWAAEDELVAMSDAEIIEFVCEDLAEFIDNAEWQVVRESSHEREDVGWTGRRARTLPRLWRRRPGTAG